jgi:nitroreductase
MDVFEAIEQRFSVREYLETPVPEEALHKLLTAMRYAPSATNRQPWKFIIIRDKKIKEKLAVACKNQQMIAQAPVVIAACGYTDGCYKRMGGFRSSLDIDLAIAFDHLMLAATEMDLGTCWVGAFIEEEVHKVLEIPEGVRVAFLTPLGYPSPQQNRPHGTQKDDRKPLSQIVCYDTFQ